MSPANPLRQINAYEQEARRRWTPFLVRDPERVTLVIDLVDRQCQVMRDLSRDGIMLDVPEWIDLGPAQGAD